MCGSSDNRTCCGPSLAAMEKVSILHNWHPSTPLWVGETCEVTMGQWGKLFHEAARANPGEAARICPLICPLCWQPFKYWKVDNAEGIFKGERCRIANLENSEQRWIAVSHAGGHNDRRACTE